MLHLLCQTILSKVILISPNCKHENHQLPVKINGADDGLHINDGEEGGENEETQAEGKLIHSVMILKANLFFKSYFFGTKVRGLKSIYKANWLFKFFQNRKFYF